MTLGVHRTNCTLGAPNFGHYDLLVTGLGFGKSIVATEEEARRTKTFYTQVATSGEWFVEALFRSHREMSHFGLWLLGYYNRVIDPARAPLLPMSVTVRSRNFQKVGYPVSTIDFGDEFGKVVYPMKINFASASEPAVTIARASKYVSPIRDSAVGRTMAPGGLQEPGYTPPPFVIGSVLGPR